MVPAGFFRVSLPDKAIFIKILITNGKQLRLKQSSSPIHIVLQHPMPESRKLPAAQYDTVHHGAKHPAVRHQPPLLSGGREGVPALPQQQENTGGMGLQKLYDDMPARISRAIHLNLEAISTIRPITGIATRSWGLLRNSRSASVRYAGSMAGKRRYSSTGTPRNTTGKHFVGIPPQDTSTTGRWYREYQPLVALVPRSGTRRTLVRYFSYQAVVRTVPSKEIYWYMHTTDRQQGIQYEFTNIFSLSLFPVSAGLYKTET